MKGILSKAQTFLTPPVVIGSAFGLACLAILFVSIYASRTPSAQTVVVTRGSVTGAVETTGTVSATESIDLGFSRGGTIGTLPVSVGSQVATGQVLATLSNGDLVAARDGAQAALEAQQAKLADLQAGARPEELATARIAVEQAIESGYIAADDAVHNKVDQFINNPRTVQPTLTFLTTNQQITTDTLALRVSAESMLSSWHDTLPELSNVLDTDLIADAKTARDHLDDVNALLDAAAASLTSAIPANTNSSAVLYGYQTNIAAARANVSAALATLNSAEGHLALDVAGATSDQVAAQEAAVAAAQASLDAANVDLAHSVIRAPIAVTIVRQDGNTGEVVAAGQSFISLNSNAHFEVKTLVSEVDMAKIKVGQTATVRLDAYPDSTFSATVVAIDPSATITSGVPAYKVTVQFTDADARIKAGLTANLSIDIGGANDTLVVPQSAIITQGTQTYVLVIKGSVRTLTPVVVGTIDNSGNAQIVSGISEGDRVAAFGTSAQ